MVLSSITKFTVRHKPYVWIYPGISFYTLLQLASRNLCSGSPPRCSWLLLCGHDNLGKGRTHPSRFHWDALLCSSTQPTQIAKFMGPTWGPPGFCRPQMGPMLAPWTLLSGKCLTRICHPRLASCSSDWIRMSIQWNLSITTTSIINSISCDLFNNVF